MPRVESTYIQITLSCPEYGYEWDVKDYDSQSVDEAISKTEYLLCPKICPKFETK